MLHPHPQRAQPSVPPMVEHKGERRAAIAQTGLLQRRELVQAGQNDQHSAKR
jgi:hypothetical protein